MTEFYRKIVKHGKLIIAIFLVLSVVCALCKQFVAVNYDMNDYLPPESASTQALAPMEREYDGGIPNARVMVSNVTVAQALEYRGRRYRADGQGQRDNGRRDRP